MHSFDSQNLIFFLHLSIAQALVNSDIQWHMSICLGTGLEGLKWRRTVFMCVPIACFKRSAVRTAILVSVLLMVYGGNL